MHYFYGKVIMARDAFWCRVLQSRISSFMFARAFLGHPVQSSDFQLAALDAL